MNCKNIDIDHREYRASKLIHMLSIDELTIPNFENDTSRNSEFIEGMLIGAVPIDMVMQFSLDLNGDKKYTMLNGKKRLAAINDFINNKFALSGMEFLPQLEGLKFIDLPNSLVSSILDTVFNVSVIRDVYKDEETTKSIIRRFS